MRTFLRFITVLAAFGLVAACAETGEKKTAAEGGKSLAMQYADAISAGQKRLTAALKLGGAEKAPEHSTEAQKKMDCWIAEANANQKKKAAACQSDFYGAMALLEAAAFAPPKPKAEAQTSGPPRTKHFLVFFGLDSAEITSDEAKIVGEAAEFVKANKGSNVYVTGHTDQSGSSEYNMKLAEKRTDAVVASLTGMGIKKSGIGAVVQGENDPAVNRAGKKEGRNRRVVISVIY